MSLDFLEKKLAVHFRRKFVRYCIDYFSKLHLDVLFLWFLWNLPVVNKLKRRFMVLPGHHVIQHINAWLCIYVCCPCGARPFTRTNVDLLSIKPSGTNFGEICIKMQKFSCYEIIWKYMAFNISYNGLIYSGVWYQKYVQLYLFALEGFDIVGVLHRLRRLVNTKLFWNMDTCWGTGGFGKYRMCVHY